MGYNVSVTGEVSDNVTHDRLRWINDQVEIIEKFLRGKR